VDGIIDSRETRRIISTGIEAASHQRHMAPYNVGVIQT
jgi:3-methylcrotonyl-CoA carboxylase beta subunit